MPQGEPPSRSLRLLSSRPGPQPLPAQHPSQAGRGSHGSVCPSLGAFTHTQSHTLTFTLTAHSHTLCMHTGPKCPGHPQQGMWGSLPQPGPSPQLNAQGPVGPHHGPDGGRLPHGASSSGSEAMVSHHLPSPHSQGHPTDLMALIQHMALLPGDSLGEGMLGPKESMWLSGCGAQPWPAPPGW